VDPHKPKPTFAIRRGVIPCPRIQEWRRLVVNGQAIERRPGLAEVQNMLLATATTVRTFLLPHWRRWHEAWGPPAPTMLSQWTCVRSSLLLVRALERQGIPVALRSGQPVVEAANDAGGNYGLLTVGGWAGHAWVEAAGFVIDITADQFGHAPVLVTSVDDPAYRHADEGPHQLKPTLAGVAAVDEIWTSWCSYVDQQCPLTGGQVATLRG